MGWRENVIERGGPAHLYNAGVGLRKWRATRAKLLSGTAEIFNLNVIGDSITEGYIATDMKVDGFFALLRAAAIAKFGDVGVGFFPSFHITNYTQEIVRTGTGWLIVSVGGIGNRSYRTSVSGDYATVAFNGTGLRIYTLMATFAGTFTVTVDAGEPTALDNEDVTTHVKYWDITGLSAGDHTAVITNTEEGRQMYIYGVAPLKGTSGLRVNMMGRASARAADSLIETSGISALDLMFDASFAPDLSIISLGANEVLDQTPLSEFKQSMQTIITAAQSTGDVLLTSIGVRSGSFTIPQYDYVNVIKNLAFENSCAFLDIYSRWGGSEGAIASGYMVDTVHPNDAGHYDIASAIIDALGI